jgi:hypothetical protein
MTKKSPRPGVIIPDDPLTKWLEEPDTRRSLTKALIEKLRAEKTPPSTSSKSSSEEDLAP